MSKPAISAVLFDSRLSSPHGAAQLKITEDLDENVAIEMKTLAAPAGNAPDPSAWALGADRPEVHESVAGPGTDFTLYIGKAGDGADAKAKFWLIDNASQETVSSTEFKLTDYAAAVSAATKQYTAAAMEIDNLADLGKLLAQFNDPASDASRAGAVAASLFLRDALSPLAKSDQAFLLEFTRKFDTAFAGDLLTASLIAAFSELPGGQVTITAETTAAAKPRRDIM